MHEHLAHEAARCRDGCRGLPTQGRERWRFLAEASAILDQADDPEEVIGALLRVSVPQFADFCVVRLENDAAIAHPRLAVARPEIMHAMARRTHMPPRAALSLVHERDATAPVGRSEHSETPLLDLDETALREIAGDDAQLRALRALGPVTALKTPIAARGCTHGIVYFVTVDASERRYRRTDVPTALDLMQRVATALDRALRRSVMERTIRELRGSLEASVVTIAPRTRTWVG